MLTELLRPRAVEASPGMHLQRRTAGCSFLDRPACHWGCQACRHEQRPCVARRKVPLPSPLLIAARMAPSGGSGYGAVTTGGQAYAAQGGSQQPPASGAQVRRQTAAYALELAVDERRPQAFQTLQPRLEPAQLLAQNPEQAPRAANRRSSYQTAAGRT